MRATEFPRGNDLFSQRKGIGERKKYKTAEKGVAPQPGVFDGLHPIKAGLSFCDPTQGPLWPPPMPCKLVV